MVRYPDEVDELFIHASSNSKDGLVLLESFINGPQISTESLMINGEISTPGFADRNYDQLNDFLPYIMENGGGYLQFMNPIVQKLNLKFRKPLYP